jgi:hypothetical protein
MKLPSTDKTLNSQLSEFDLWVTPSLGDIRDSDEFNDTFLEIQKGIDIIAEITNGYEGIETCSSQAISENLIKKSVFC